MIQRQTLFILGAGASSPYGFPTGEALVSEIITELSNRGLPLHNILVELEHRPGDIDEFRDALQGSALGSIDAFLESNREFLNLGKLAIAYRLLSRGQYRSHFGRTNPQDVYSYLFRQMQGGTQDFDSFMRIPVRWVTYNYDRSLEAFLQRSVSATYPEARKKVPELGLFDVVHLHGHLGNSRWATGVREDATPPSTEIVREAANGIQIIPDTERGIAKAYDRTHGWMRGFAEQIVLLGFGFHPTNLERLQLGAASDREVFATRYKLGQARVDDVQALVGPDTPIHFGDLDDDSVRLLEKKVRFIRDIADR